MYKNTMGEMGLQTIALCTLSSNISAPRQKIKKMHRMLRCSVLDDPLQNSSFHDTWLCQNKMYKNTMGKMGLLILGLCTLSSNISAPRHKI